VTQNVERPPSSIDHAVCHLVKNSSFSLQNYLWERRRLDFFSLSLSLSLDQSLFPLTTDIISVVQKGEKKPGGSGKLQLLFIRGDRG